MTTSTSVADLLANVTNYQYNPAAIQSAILQVLTDITDGSITVVDPTNPFIFCLESAAVLTSAAMAKNETNTRKQYPYSAQTVDDLYLHMSDKDYIDRFAIPSKTKMSLVLPVNEVIAKMVTDSDTGINKLVIPRNSVFTIASTDFSIQYPIQICQLAHGGLQVTYDTDITSPLQTLSTNVIDYELRQNSDGEYLYFEFDVYQFNIITNTSTLNSAVDFSIDVTITDQYYYTRVYSENTDGTWTEIKTTHTDQIYDIEDPTAVIKVVDKVVTVSIPQIYTGTSVLNKGIRVDVYQTKGDIEMILWEYQVSSFSAQWLAIDDNDNDEYVAPLKTLSNVMVFSDSTVAGGSDGITFSTLRSQVINNALGGSSVPITSAQIESSLTINGYSVVKNIDNITNRVFIATKEMPIPTDESLITAAASSIETISIKVSTLITHSTVIDNDTSITITPDTIYQNVDGVVSPITDDELNTILQLPIDQRATVVSDGDYLYTPFHYVLDMTEDELAVRPYYLDAPTVVSKSFVSENDTTLIQVNTGSYSITKSSSGYLLTLTTESGDAYKALADDEVQVQLAFTPTGEVDLAYINGTLLSTNDEGERVYTFDLSTNFNVNSAGDISLSKFFLYTTEERLTETPLLTEFDVFYTTSSTASSSWVTSTIDESIGSFLLPTNTYAITREKLRIRFGYSLDTLWARSRSTISAAVYKTWEVNVPRVYEEDVYQLDANGSSITFDASGNPVMVVLHAKGDAVLDSDGNPTYLHVIGDTVLDAYDNPVIADARGLLRQFDIFMVEGVYWFATDQTAIDYKDKLTTTVVEWLTTDLETISEQLLEQTNIYFYPSTTLGSIDVLVGSGLTKTIDAGQAFTVTLSVSALVYNDSTLRTKLTSTTISVINSKLKSDVVAVDDIISELRTQYGDDVISVQLTGLGGSSNYPVITITDTSQRCGIKKRLSATADNNLIVEEAVDVEFIKYAASS